MAINITGSIWDFIKVKLLDSTGADAVGPIQSALNTLNSLTPSTYDYISLSYTSSNLTTVVFKLGGSGGSTVSTLTLAYDGSNNLISVTKT